MVEGGGTSFLCDSSRAPALLVRLALVVLPLQHPNADDHIEQAHDAEDACPREVALTQEESSSQDHADTDADRWFRNTLQSAS